MRKFLLIILIISCLFLAIFASAQIDLEQTYPEITDKDSGMAVQQTLTGKSTLPALIQYLTNWALILAALVVVIFMVIGGIQYLTSSGRPEKMTDARKKISNSLLGLAILAGSYLILVTINPQLTVMSLVVTPVDSGIILLTEEGYESFKTKNLNDILLDGNAKIFTTDLVDLTQETDFGPLVLSGEQAKGKIKVNFANFPIYAIGFWGREGGFSDNVKIVAYDDKYFKQSDPKEALKPREYKKAGKLDVNGNIVERPSIETPVAEISVYIIWVEAKVDSPASAIVDTDDPNETDFFLSAVKYINLEKQTYFNKVQAGEDSAAYPWVDKTTEVYHPPLSIALKGLGPGVYLYSDEGGQRYFVSSNENFGLSDMDFDNLADKIEINDYAKDDEFDSKKPEENEPSHNFLVVLHDYYHFAGNLRLFFTKTKVLAGEIEPFIPKIYLDQMFFRDDITLCNDEDLTRKDGAPAGCNVGDRCKVTDNGNNAAQNNHDLYHRTECRYIGEQFLPGNIDLMVSPVPAAADADKELKTKKVDINKHDVYGAIKSSSKVSSIQLFELVPPIKLTENFKWSEFKVAGERSEECREVRICTEKGGNGDCISYTPGGRVFSGAYDSITLPMPYFVPVNIPKKLKGVVKTVGDEGDEYKIENKKFADKIKSIIIRGDCLVVLFENALTSLTVDAAKNLSGAWEGNTPGSHSEIFLKSDWNLTDNEIARCGSARGIGFGEPKGCASAIAVFPVRIIE